MTPAGGSALGRREFLGTCTGAIACAALSGCASVMARPVTAVDGRILLTLADHPELAARNGAITILPSGTADPILVLRTGDRTYAALSAVCTHRGCTVEVAGDRLECPCHGSQYNREGTVLEGPAERALGRFTTRVEGSRLIIDLGQGR